MIIVSYIPMVHQPPWRFNSCGGHRVNIWLSGSSCLFINSLVRRARTHVSVVADWSFSFTHLFCTAAYLNVVIVVNQFSETIHEFRGTYIFIAFVTLKHDNQHRSNSRRYIKTVIRLSSLYLGPLHSNMKRTMSLKVHRSTLSFQQLVMISLNISGALLGIASRCPRSKKSFNILMSLIGGSQLKYGASALLKISQHVIP